LESTSNEAKEEKEGRRGKKKRFKKKKKKIKKRKEDGRKEIRAFGRRRGRGGEEEEKVEGLRDSFF